MNCKTPGCTVIASPHTHEIITSIDSEKARTAEEITDYLCDLFGFDKGCAQAMEIEVALKSHATEYAESRVREAVTIENKRCMDFFLSQPFAEELKAEGYKAGQEAMRERAAKVAHKHFLHDDCAEDCVDNIEKEIRSLSIEKKA